jgi:hypothetical protein
MRSSTPLELIQGKGPSRSSSMPQNRSCNSFSIALAGIVDNHFKRKAIASFRLLLERREE